MRNCLGFLPFSDGVHDDLPGQPRRETYRGLIAAGKLPAGHATEHGTGLHYTGTRLHEALSILPGSRAWLVEAGESGYTETPIDARHWVPAGSRA